MAGILDIGQLILGALGLGQSQQQQKTATKQEQASADYYKQITQQAQQAQVLMQKLMPQLFSMAGLQTSPGPMGALGAPASGAANIGQITPTNPANYAQSPYYQAAYGAFSQPLEAYRRQQLSGANAQNLRGQFQAGFSPNLINRDVARSQAGFNQNWMANERTNQQQWLQNLTGLLQGQQQAGQPAAAGLAGIGANQYAIASQGGANSIDALSQAIGQMLYQNERRNKANTPSAVAGQDYMKVTNPFGYQGIG